MRRTDELITQVRRETDNVEYGTDYGIPQAEFIQYLAEAQEQLQGAILRANPHCSWFLRQTTTSLVSGTSDYAIPSDCYYTNNLLLVEFSSSSDTDDYIPLQRKSFIELQADASWPPVGYALYNGNIRLSPPPDASSGSLRITYIRRLPGLKLTAGQITSLVGASLTLDNDTYLDATSLSAVAYPGIFSIGLTTGPMVSLSMTCSGYNSGTRVLTVSAGPTYETGYAAANLPAAFVTIGHNTTSISQLPEDCERYLLNYCTWRILKRDASDEAKWCGEQLQAIEANIVSSLSAPATDYQLIPMEF